MGFSVRRTVILFILNWMYNIFVCSALDVGKIGLVGKEKIFYS